MSDKVDIIEVSPVRKNKPTAILGFTGPGFIGSTALMYMVRTKGFTQRAQVKSHLIPPMMLLIGGTPTPVFRIYGDDKDEADDRRHERHYRARELLLFRSVSFDLTHSLTNGLAVFRF